MANPQPENGFVKLANDIWNELIRRNFTKRQKDILLFVWRLSYGCNLKDAFIPKLKDFEVCGVPATHIKNELKHLENSKVIFWDKAEKIFSINKDYDYWQISPVMGWDTERFNELIHVNLKRKTSQNMKSDFTKHEVFEDVNFTKHEVGCPSNPCSCKAEEALKDSFFKDSIKDNSCCIGGDMKINQDNQNPDQFDTDSQDAVPAGDTDSNRKAAELNYRKQVADLYLKRRGKGLEISVKDEILLDELIADRVPIHVALAGITKAFDKFKPKHKKDEIKSLNFCESFIYALHAEEPSEVDSKDDIVLDSSNSSEDEGSEEEYEKLLEKLKSKRGVEV